jgi:hypothetical protein
LPEISRFFGIVILMYPREHWPPHFHARYAGFRAVVGIAPVAQLRGRLPARVLALIVEWATLYQTELLANWERLRRHETPRRIPPLE